MADDMTKEQRHKNMQEGIDIEKIIRRFQENRILF